MVLTSSGELKALILIGAVFVVGAIGIRLIFSSHEPAQEPAQDAGRTPAVQADTAEKPEDTAAPDAPAADQPPQA